MNKHLLLAVALFSARACVALSQSPDASRLWIFVDDHQQSGMTMYYGNAVNATYYIDDGTGETTNYWESIPGQGGPPFGFDTRWKGIPGRNNVPISDGLYPLDYRAIPANSTMKDTFNLYFENTEIPDSSFYFSWPDATFLQAECDSMFIAYNDPIDGPQYINMFTQKSLEIPAAGQKGIVHLYIYKYGVHLVDAVLDMKGRASDMFVLSDAFPSPFNSQTNITYSIASRTHVTLKIYDVLGREIAVLTDEDRLPGSYTARWNANGLASGLYFYTIRAGTFIETKKVQLVK